MGLYRVDDENGEPIQAGAGKVTYEDMVEAVMAISQADKDINAQIVSYSEGNKKYMHVTTSEGKFYKGYIYDDAV